MSRGTKVWTHSPLERAGGPGISDGARGLRPSGAAASAQFARGAAQRQSGQRAELDKAASFGDCAVSDVWTFPAVNAKASQARMTPPRRGVAPNAELSRSQLSEPTIERLPLPVCALILLVSAIASWALFAWIIGLVLS